MAKWIVMLVCALSLTACGSMQSTSSSGYGEQSSASGGVTETAGLMPGAYGDGTLGVPGP
ncbi:MAG: hypothetical protein ACXU7D_04720 [Burkholderiaceae bacterium]